MASDELTVNKIISSLEDTVKRTIDFVDSEIGKVVEVPPYKDTKETATLYTGYKETVEGYHKICDAVALLSQTQIKLRIVKRKLAECEVLPSMRGSFKNRLDITLNDIDLCRQSALVLKDSYDARLRFYGSTQYMLSSARYNEVKY